MDWCCENSLCDSLNDVWDEFLFEVDDEEDEHSRILSFYNNLLESLIDEFSISVDAMMKAVEYIRSKYRQLCLYRISKIDYNEIMNCLAYLHTFAACHAAMVESAVIEVFYNHISISEIDYLFLEKSQLNLMGFGSGPGNDIVGFLSAICGKHQNFSNIDITAVDEMAGWETTFHHTMRRLRNGLENSDACKTIESAEVRSLFLEEDITQKSILWKKTTLTKLSKADVVLLVKAMSTITDNVKLLALQNIVDNMKPNALLFFIDWPVPEAEFKDICISNGMKIIYKTDEEQFIFSHKREIFGEYNLTRCKFAVVILKKTDLKGKNEMPCLEDGYEWPTLGNTDFKGKNEMPCLKDRCEWPTLEETDFKQNEMPCKEDRCEWPILEETELDQNNEMPCIEGRCEWPVLHHGRKAGNTDMHSKRKHRGKILSMNKLGDFVYLTK